MSGPVASRTYKINLSDGTAFEEKALSASKTTAALNVEGWKTLKLGLEFEHSAATAVTMTAQESDDGTVWRDVQILGDPSSGTQTSDDRTLSRAVTANKNWSWSIPIDGYVYVRCTFAGASGDASDLLTVKGRVSA